MDVVVTIKNKRYQLALNNSWSLAIPLTFAEEQVNHFAAERATSKAMQAGGFVGDVSLGGSCNVATLQLTPHCNGTHTESISHICQDAILFDQLPNPEWQAAQVISVTPTLAADTDESYSSALEKNDRLITKQQLSAQCHFDVNDEITALIIRTLPNCEQKKTTQYNTSQQPAFLTHEAMLFINELGIRHLLVDLPSVDKMYDQGKLSNHRLFWQVSEGGVLPQPNSQITKTITELIFVDNLIADGLYLLALFCPRFATDAVPSNPVIYPVTAL